MFGEIKKNVESIAVLIDQYNKELDDLKKTMDKSVAEVIKEVRQEEGKKAEEAIHMLTLKHQEEVKKAYTEKEALQKIQEETIKKL